MKIDAGISNEFVKPRGEQVTTRLDGLQSKESPKSDREQSLVEEYSDQNIEESVEQINAYTKLKEVGLLLKVDRDLDNMIIVKMIDRESEEVIKQIPSKEAVELAMHLKKVFEDSEGSEPEAGRFLNDIV